MRRVLLALLLLIGALPWAPSAVRAADVVPRFKGDVATFRIVNDNGAAASDRVVSFGQMFRQGQVRPGAGLTARLNGVGVPIQMDAKAMYPDGSVRHAVMAVRTQGPPVGGSLAGVITATGGPASAAVLVPPSSPAIQVAVTFQAGPDKGKTFTIALPAQTTQSGTAPPPARWLGGPLVDERRYLSLVMHGIQVVFDVWTPVVGPSRVDVIFHNDSAQAPDIATQTYDATVILDGKPVYRALGVAHHAYSTWHKEIYTDGKPPPRVVPNVDTLMALGAVPQYVRFRPDAATVGQFYKQAISNPRPLAAANLTPYMPTTGGRSDIGPLPAWAVFFLLDPSRENDATLLANADAAGAIPWHVRDMRTDGPIVIDRYPTVWLDYRGKAVPGILGRRYENPPTPWQPDDAHQPSLTYLPYLLTGSQYYRDELAMQAGYNLLAMNPEYRGQAAGIHLGSQVRGVAWSLRTLANAAYILPTDGRLQAYFQAKLQGNLREIVRRHVGDPVLSASALRGYLPGPYAVEGAVAPWQDDYLVMVLGWINAMGYAEARPVIEWMTNFVAGRFTNAARGYDPIYGTPYTLFVNDPRSQRTFTTWAEAFKASFDPVREPIRTLDYPDWGGGYAALARGSLASIINATGSPQAREAYGFVRAQTPRMELSYPSNPTFAIAPQGM